MKIMELTVKEYEKIMKEQIDEEDKDIPLIPDDELYDMKDWKLDYNFKVLYEKINQIARKINEEGK